MKLKAQQPKETESKPGLKSDAENDLQSAPLPELEKTLGALSNAAAGSVTRL